MKKKKKKDAIEKKVKEKEDYYNNLLDNSGENIDLQRLKSLKEENLLLKEKIGWILILLFKFIKC